METRLSLMLFLTAHCLGSWWAPRAKKPSWRSSLLSLLWYVLGVALAFAPCLDGNNINYALAMIALRIVLLFPRTIAEKKAKSGRARRNTAVAFEAFSLLFILALAYVHSVRWGYLEPWRSVRFLLDNFALDWSQVLAFGFIVLTLARPANRLVRAFMPVEETGGECEMEETAGEEEIPAELGEKAEKKKGPGWLVGVLERLLSAFLALSAGWLGYSAVLFGKCCLFCLVVKSDGERGMRLFLGTLLSFLAVIPVALLAGPFIW